MRILNKYKDQIPSNAVYIGRGSGWGNPFVIGQHGDRKEVCDKFDNLVWEGIFSGEYSLESFLPLYGKDLVCFCSPKRCHGETLKSVAQYAYTKLKEKL